LKKKIEDAVNEFNAEGYSIINNFLSLDECKEIINYLSNLKAKVNLPFTNIPWGYGNLLNKGPFEKLTNNNYIKEFCENIFSTKDYVFNHLMVHNKAPWVGAGIEWHQEVFNIDTYAPGYSADSWKSFAQIYISLEEQTVENGCIKLVPKSHTLGLLPHEDAINDLLAHKRRVPFEVMQKIYKSNGIKNCELKPGDMLLFNHMIVHGSGSNASPKSRKAIVLQARSNIKEKSSEIFERETEFRKNFVVKSLQDKIDTIKDKNIYLDMKKNN
jgi:hypothetical protein